MRNEELEPVAFEYTTEEGNFRKVRKDKFGQEWTEESRFRTDVEPLVRVSDIRDLIQQQLDQLSECSAEDVVAVTALEELLDSIPEGGGE